MRNDIPEVLLWVLIPLWMFSILGIAFWNQRKTNHDAYIKGFVAGSAVMGLVHTLRNDEDAAVTIFCDNPQSPPNVAIMVDAPWTTGSFGKRFSGNSVEECLRKAVAHREIAMAMQSGTLKHDANET